MSNINEQNEVLIEQLLAGDTSARDRLIEINRPLVYTTVKRVLNIWIRFRHLRDDLIGVGMVALIQAIDRLKEIAEPERPIRNYLITAIRSKLKTELMGQDGDKGQVAHYQSIRYVDTYSKVPEQTLVVTEPVFKQIENREFLLSLCESERDRKILILFFEGLRIIDIVEATGYTKNIVNKTLRQIRRKAQNSQDLVSESGSI